jgi:hypothetical protein
LESACAYTWPCLCLRYSSSSASVVRLSFDTMFKALSVVDIVVQLFSPRAPSVAGPQSCRILGVLIRCFVALYASMPSCAGIQWTSMERPLVRSSPVFSKICRTMYAPERPFGLPRSGLQPCCQRRCVCACVRSLGARLLVPSSTPGKCSVVLLQTPRMSFPIPCTCSLFVVWQARLQLLLCDSLCSFHLYIYRRYLRSQ